jgi:diguanylate cyclase (GGDEF)-like protein/PAS domain S-box-containing protein
MTAARPWWERLPPLSVGRRIALGFLGVVLIELLVTGVGLWYSSSVAATVGSARAGITRLRDVDALERSLFAVEGTVEQSLLTRQGSLVGTRVDQPLQDFRVELDRVVPAGRGDRFATTDQLRSLRLLGVDLGTVVGKIALATRDNRWARAEALRHTEMSSLQSRFQAALDQLRAVVEADVVATSARSSRGESTLRWYWLSSAVILLVGSGGLGYLTSRRITGPVNALVMQTARVKEGDFSAVQASGQRDELGLLSRSFAQMTDRLRTTYEDLGQRVQELQSARDSLGRSAHRLEALVTLDRAILARESPADIAEQALGRLRGLVPAGYAAVWLAAEDGSGPKVLAVHGADPDASDADAIPVQMASRIVEPLVVHHRVVGALAVASAEPGIFTTEHREIAREVAAELALAVQQARLLEQMQGYAKELELRVEQLWQSEERFRNLVEAAPDAIVSVDGQDRVVLANGRAEQLFGYSRTELLGLPLRTLVPDWHPAVGYVPPDAASGSTFPTLPLPREHSARRHDGGTFPVEITVGRVRAAAGDLTTSIIRDITERKRFEEQLVYLADHDALTGLANKRRFEQELDAHLARISRSGRPSGAVLFLDLDNLKYVNDSLGHSVGDQLIRSIPSALRGRLRSSDLMARLGGDEFAILLPEAGPSQAALVAEDLLSAVRLHRLAQNGKRIQTTTSIGIAVIDDVTAKVEDLLVAADLAMYEAKDRGRDRAATFVEARRHGAAAPLAWSARIRQALERDEFRVYCQPILDLRSDRVTRYEALVRMVGPEGCVEPGDFLPVAERFGLITAIDRWMVHRAVELVAAMSMEARDTAVEVNVSGRSVTDDGFFTFVAAEIASAGIDPAKLVFEITETQVIANMGEAVTFAEKLVGLGCEFALDDFGAGFASFYYLKHLPLTYLKLDGDFIRSLPSSRSDQVMVQAMVEVARGLGMQTIAEFVGDTETVTLLKEFGVDYAQGYFVGRPRNADDAFVAEVRGTP